MAKKVNDTVISVKHVAKDFVLPHEKSNSIKSKIVQIFKEKNNSKDIQHALRDISFEVKKGEFFGIVGRNGSGKSTLLKIISQIYKPSKGTVDIKGRLVPFIELGVGFNPDLTGRENVYLNGALLGFSRKEIDAQYNDIVEFAELEEFMDQKLKNYSSGMQVRLAFSVAIRADSDILILDEVLAVGDEAFQRKCNDYFFKAKREGKTIVLVTHSMESVRQFCDRVVLIDDGLIKAEGEPDKVADEYSKMFIDQDVFENTENSENRWGTGKVIVDSIEVSCDDEHFKAKVILADHGNEAGEIKMALRIRDQDGYLVAGMNNLNATNYTKLKLDRNERKEIVFTAPNIFGNQLYTVESLIVSVVNNDIFDSWNESAKFRSSKGNAHYPVIVPSELKIMKVDPK